MKFSNRVQEMQFSPIRKFNPVAAKVKEQGKKVYHFNIGQPDVATPECFMQAIKSFDEAVIKYAESGGLFQAVRHALRQKRHDRYKRWFRSANNGIPCTC